MCEGKSHQTLDDGTEHPGAHDMVGHIITSILITDLIKAPLLISTAQKPYTRFSMTMGTQNSYGHLKPLSATLVHLS